MNKKLILIIVFLLAAVFTIGHQNNPTQTNDAKRTWDVKDSKVYAKDVLQAWSDNQYKCLDKLWTKESHWRPEAYNKIKVMGKNAGGIPQILGLDPKTPAPLQIDRGIKYIIHRHGTPCMAWKFHQRKGWY